MSQINTAYHGICHDCNNTAEVPSLILRTALFTFPIVSDLCGVDVQRFQERS